MRRSLATAVAVLLLAGLASADTIERGAVVQKEASEIYVNLGREDGVRAGDRLRIKRPISLRHPVSGKQVEDWLPVGSARVRSVGTQLTMAVLDEDLYTRVEPGDLVEILASGRTAAAPAPSADRPTGTEPAPEGPLPEVDPDSAAVLAVWRDTAGQRLESRIEAWETYLGEHAGSPYAPAVRADLELLRAMRERLEPPELALEDAPVGGVRHAPPDRGTPGEALQLAFLLDAPRELAAAWLHYRRAGAASYKKLLLRRDGDGYLRGTVPAAAVAGPGLDYFVELASRAGTVGTAVGTPEQPIAVAIASPPLTRELTGVRDRSRIALTSTYMDFATFDARSGDRTDRFYQFEADFFYRLRRTLHGVRAGFGVLGGEGGFANQVWERTSPAPEAGFTYGFAEVELRGPHHTGYIGRLIAGVGQDGFGAGIDGRVRLGPEDGTNLSVGASALAEVGFLTEIRMQWQALRHLPLGLAIGLTDQPNQGDLGVRFTTDIGWRALDWMQPTLRLSYQARTVVHSGVGAGLGLVFDW